MSRVARYLLERLTALDLSLPQYFGRRELDRSLSWRHAQRHIEGPAGPTVADSRESERTNIALGGLEVEITDDEASVFVRRGTMLCNNPSPVTLARPGAWSGGLESDDYARGVFTNVVDFLPSIPGDALSVTPTTGVEWWTVYVTPEEKTIETSTAHKVFNEGTGLFDTSSAPKVKQHYLTPAIIRGSPGGSIPDPPAGSVVIAWIHVPNGASDLGDAVIYDVRRLLHDDPGPNEIGGAWRADFEGVNATPYTGAIFQGVVTARLSGERLSARCDTSSLKLADIMEPSVIWDPDATPSSPRFAWLYLCKVKGLVPRPVRRGTLPLGNDPTSYAADGVWLQGALVLSPKPPRIGSAEPDGLDLRGRGLRWDLRPSTSLKLPSHGLSGGIPYAYSGITVPADEAICVGFMRYVGVDAAVPQLVGSLFVDEQGWVTGSSIASGGTFTDPTNLAFLPTFSVDNAVTPRLLKSAVYGPLFITVATLPQPAPIVALRLRVLAIASVLPTGNAALGLHEDAGKAWLLDADKSAMIEVERRVKAPGQRTMPKIEVGLLSPGEWASGSATLQAVRLPYGEALVT